MALQSFIDGHLEFVNNTKTNIKNFYIFNKMFNILLKIFIYIYNLFYNKETNIKESEKEYVSRKLNDWKVDLYASNVYLVNIPHKLIYEKQLFLQKEYLDKINK
jgi:hypothetical protein